MGQITYVLIEKRQPENLSFQCGSSLDLNKVLEVQKILFEQYGIETYIDKVVTKS